jgi:DeoR family suf operon transcriptional repressor
MNAHSGSTRGLGKGFLCKPRSPGYHCFVAQKATVAEHERLNPTLESLPRTRREVLILLKKRGEASVEELASALGITVSAVRQHLTGLEAVGFAAHRSVSDGPGRPRFLYRLSAGAEALFPKYYSELTNELLSYVQDEDPETLERIFKRRRQRRVEGAVARLRGKSFPEKVAELARILDEDGYLADFEALPDGSFLVTEHNCAILGVARKWGLACSTEIEFLREAIPEANIARVAHMMAGAHVCRYEIRRRPRARRTTS